MSTWQVTQNHVISQFDPNTEDIDRVVAGLATRAELSGDIDVAINHYDSPIGKLLLGATTRGVVRVAFPQQDESQVLQEISDMVSPKILMAPKRLEPAMYALDDYFCGRSPDVNVAIDHTMARGFRRQVQQVLASIRAGTTISYSQLAEMAGRPRAIRAAASACATNPVPILLPCHRVVRSDGAPGNYLGGASAKEHLLTHEGRRFGP